MKKICFLILAALISTAAMAQTAKSVLDKAAANITVKEGVKANFRMVGGIGNASGTILIKGKKFHATTPKATVWFDGKTMWTYMKDNEEVNVSNPTEAQLQTINPYNFINLYKNGYTSTLNTTGNAYVVHLTSNSCKERVGQNSTSPTSRSRRLPILSSVSMPRTSPRLRSSICDNALPTS